MKTKGNIRTILITFKKLNLKKKSDWLNKTDIFKSSHIITLNLLYYFQKVFKSHITIIYFFFIEFLSTIMSKNNNTIINSNKWSI